MLWDPTRAEFRLREGSPCIDAADDLLASSEDKNRGARYDVPDKGVAVADMGAYEYRP